jgi:hypothetical protein
VVISAPIAFHAARGAALLEAAKGIKDGRHIFELYALD